MNSLNTINGQPLCFGDPEHIAYVLELQQLFSGERGFEPEIVFWNYAASYHGRYAESIWDADQLRARFECKRHGCRTRLLSVKGYAPPPAHYHSLLQPWPEVTCSRCGTRYRIDEDDIAWVIPEEKK